MIHELLLYSLSDGQFVLLDDGSLVCQSEDAYTSTGAFATDTTGVKYTYTFSRTFPHVGFFGSVFAVIVWEVRTVSAGAPTAKVNVDLQRSGVAIDNFTAVSGPSRSLAAILGTRYTERIMARISDESIAISRDTLDVLIEIEVDVASGVGGSTAAVALMHDPTDQRLRSFLTMES